MTKGVADWYTPRIAKRAELARALKARGSAWLRGARLTEADLDEIIRHGDEAKAADREQQAQLAEHHVERAGRARSAADVTEREDDLAATLPAVAHDLQVAGHGEDATFLAKLSFARYRMRTHDVPVEPTSESEATTIRKIERVERSDVPTRAEGLAALCETLASRPRIVRALAARGLDASALRALGEDATEVAASGRNSPRAAEATAREAAAVHAQKVKWSALRALIRRACRDDRDLAALLADC
ncbi:hypothetical protein [Sandaracinus amylolyticus]|uniref:Uncharacterized protein n=1 Tax=Sandaracinus amylolyticus TaxID=927083 RepID=A0A0F6SGW1_9BACT|nr:hypothetical protein [Sandaracinus amylolyticus]AKF09384.1 hypothetical protein DB32_006533 [Sandaracinus amylolyticus]